MTEKTPVSTSFSLHSKRSVPASHELYFSFRKNGARAETPAENNTTLSQRSLIVKIS
jgi:hypothetical protein